MSKIIHYRNKCIGCGICQQQQPTLWRMSKKDGKAILLQAIEKKGIYQLAIPIYLLELTITVAKACPVNVIKIV